jgi:phosphohistidine phosphatase
MSRTLYLMRHAKSAWNTGGTHDFERPLNGRGEGDARKMGHWMAGAGLRPESVRASPALRTWQTVTAVCRALDFPMGAVEFDRRLYLADRDTLCDVIAETPASVASQLLVAHNPGMEELLCHLLGHATPSPSDGNIMPTAALYALELLNEWSSLGRGEVRLLASQRPRAL